MIYSALVSFLSEEFGSELWARMDSGLRALVGTWACFLELRTKGVHEHGRYPNKAHVPLPVPPGQIWRDFIEQLAQVQSYLRAMTFHEHRSVLRKATDEVFSDWFRLNQIRNLPS